MTLSLTSLVTGRVSGGVPESSIRQDTAIANCIIRNCHHCDKRACWYDENMHCLWYKSTNAQHCFMSAKLAHMDSHRVICVTSTCSLQTMQMSLRLAAPGRHRDRT